MFVICFCFLLLFFSRNKIQYSFGGLYEKTHTSEYILIADASEGKEKENVEGLGDDASCVFLRLQIGLLHWLHFLLLGFGLKKKKGMGTVTHATDLCSAVMTSTRLD